MVQGKMVMVVVSPVFSTLPYSPQCSKDLATEPRCKSWTAGPDKIILGFQKVKQEDEGEYRVEIENEHGMQEHTFSLYVTGLIS